MKTAKPPCPVCGTLAGFWASAPDRHYGNAGLWDVYRCSACGHLFQYPIPSEEELAHFYPKTYYAYKEVAAPRMHCYSWVHRGMLRHHYLKLCRNYKHLKVSGNPLLAFLGYLRLRRPLNYDAPLFIPGGKLLDYGAGSGSTVKYATEVGWDAMGIEFNRDASEAASRNGINVKWGSIELLEKSPEMYDHIMSSHCVEHVPEAMRLLRAFFSSLKPGGHLTLDVPNADAFAVSLYGAYYYYLGMPVHVNLFSKRSLLLALESCGFIDIRVATYSPLYTQRESLLLAKRWLPKIEPTVSFHRQGLARRALASLLALPGWMLSRLPGRGDCLVVRCQRPHVAAQ